jgi:hypothetical protein
MAFNSSRDCSSVPGIVLQFSVDEQSGTGTSQGRAGQESGTGQGRVWWKDYSAESVRHSAPIKLKDMAPRLDTLDGKTIYIVDDGFVGGANLLHLMEDWFHANYPKTNIVFKRKGGGGFDSEDPQLWAEIKEKGNAVIIGMGH